MGHTIDTFHDVLVDQMHDLIKMVAVLLEDIAELEIVFSGHKGKTKGRFARF